MINAYNARYFYEIQTSHETCAVKARSLILRYFGASIHRYALNSSPSDYALNHDHVDT